MITLAYYKSNKAAAIFKFSFQEKDFSRQETLFSFQETLFSRQEKTFSRRETYRPMARCEQASPGNVGKPDRKQRMQDGNAVHLGRCNHTKR
jgi:hypothetical protein